MVPYLKKASPLFKMAGPVLALLAGMGLPASGITGTLSGLVTHHVAGSNSPGDGDSLSESTPGTNLPATTPPASTTSTTTPQVPAPPSSTPPGSKGQPGADVGPPPATQTPSTTQPPSVQSAGMLLPGTQCPAFPADNVWNTPITDLPVNADSSTWLASMDASTTFLHPDYGPSGGTPYGIPWQIVSPSQPLISIDFTYESESDPGPYPLSASTPIEQGSDAHAIMVNPSTCTLYELYDTNYVPDGQSTAGSGAIWSLDSDALRPAGWTSADAAGLPILPGLVNYDEVASGAMNHAIRFTAECTTEAYIWPARHEAGQDDPDCPPMGARFRLDASFDLPSSQCDAMCQTVITTMKTYGLILADNGSNWYFQGTSDTRWTDQDVDQLKAIPASAFVAVDESCLMVSSDSGQAYQPGTSAFASHCG